MIVPIVILFVSLIIIAVCTALIVALQNYSRLKIEIEKKQAVKYAEVVDRLSGEKSTVISALNIGKLIFLLIFGLSFYTLIPGSLLLDILLSVIVVLVLAELLPQLFASVNPDLVLRLFYRVADVFYKIFSPFVKSKKVIEEEQKTPEIKIIQNALNFTDVVLRECMIPRTEICAVEESTSYDDLLALFARTYYSRIIVYKENIDSITGYIHSKDMFRGEKPVNELIRRIDYFPETMRAQDLLGNLIKNKNTIAVALDKFGGTAGIVTLEDLIEEIFGEISDELDSDELVEKKSGDGNYIFSGRIEVKYLNREYGFNIPESENYETLAGFITDYHENIPAERDVVRYDNLLFTILKTTSNRIETVSLRIVEE